MGDGDALVKGMMLSHVLCAGIVFIGLILLTIFALRVADWFSKL
jgi:hypothetical protein